MLGGSNEKERNIYEERKEETNTTRGIGGGMKRIN
jgi:hypothetical protein